MKILVIGASARAAAQSVRRNHMEVAALDLFVDRDLREISECESIKKYPDSIVDQASQWPDHAILFCGGMENVPDVVAKLEKRNTIIGPNSGQMRALRKLSNWQAWVANSQDGWLRFPTTYTRQIAKSRITKDARWLWKPYRSAAGMLIRNALLNETLEETSGYLQRWVPGYVLGITFQCLPSNSTVVGVTRNISVNDTRFGYKEPSDLPPFLYAGSEGMVSISQETSQKLAEWIDAIAISIEYRGILQADFIAGLDGYWYLLEINPRWTASMEIIEKCTQLNLINEQLKAQFQLQAPIVSNSNVPTSKMSAIKYIVYSKENRVISPDISDMMIAQSNSHTTEASDGSEIVGWSDIPTPGTVIEANAPIATAWCSRRTVDRDDSDNGMGHASGQFYAWPALNRLIRTIQ